MKFHSLMCYPEESTDLVTGWQHARARERASAHARARTHLSKHYPIFYVLLLKIIYLFMLIIFINKV